MNDMTGFTPGPWFTGDNPPQPLYWGLIAILEHSPERLVAVWQDTHQVLDHQANARLIAAAPEMWESVQADHALGEHRLNHHGCPVACLERASLWSIAREKRVAAIAKAEGGGT